MSETQTKTHHKRGFIEKKKNTKKQEISYRHEGAVASSSPSAPRSSMPSAHAQLRRLGGAGFAPGKGRKDVYYTYIPKNQGPSKAQR